MFTTDSNHKKKKIIISRSIHISPQAYYSCKSWWVCNIVLHIPIISANKVVINIILLHLNSIFFKLFVSIISAYKSRDLYRYALCKYASHEDHGILQLISKEIDTWCSKTIQPCNDERNNMSCDSGCCWCIIKISIRYFESDTSNDRPADKNSWNKVCTKFGIDSKLHPNYKQKSIIFYQ